VADKLLGRFSLTSPKVRVWWIPTLLLLLAFLVRAAYVLHTTNFVARVDAASYNYLAQTLARGKGWGYGTSAYRPPGYPIFLAGVYLLVGLPYGVFTSARLIEAVLSTFTVAMIGLMVFQLAGRRPALIALAISAIYIPLVLVGVSLMTEALYVPLLLIAINAAIRSRVALHRYRWIVFTGIVMGCASLTRGNGVVEVPALAFVVWSTKPRWSWRALAAPITLVLVAAATISPWTIRNISAQHAFVPVSTELGTTLGGTYNDNSQKHRWIWEIGGYNNYHAIKSNNNLTEAQRDSQMTSAVVHYIGQHPQYLAEAMFWNTMRLLDLQGRRVSRMTAYADTFATAVFADIGVVQFWILGLLAIAGAFTVAARRMPRSIWWIPFLGWLSIAPVTTGTPRFRDALEPFFILLAACALEAIWARVRARASAGEIVSRAGPSLGAAEEVPALR
jgi:4-amino-4-deoxy-L-arabinose transferase-like glycosyltransferase